METPAIIPLPPLVGVNNCQPILDMPKIMVHCYSTDNNINEFAIGYMINPSRNCNKVLRIQVEKCFKISFADKTMRTIKYCLRSVMELIMIYDYNIEIPKTVYRVLSYVVYYLICKYVCIDYLSCQSNTLSSISSKPTFE